MLLRGKKQKFKQKSGILLALSSLPSPYGIGSFGKEAFSFIDFLKETHQSYWQLLPLCAIGRGNSPYSSPCCFAGEILYIDIDTLVDEGLLSPDDVPETTFPKNIDYNAVRKFKLPLLRLAAEKFDIGRKDFIKFQKDNEYWLKNFSLFMAIKDSNMGAEFTKWDDGFKYRLNETLQNYEDTHFEELLFYEITQFWFFEQFGKLKSYASKQGIKLMGDIPFYVSLESADVWANPECFRLGRDMTPILVAGVPPDIFSASGQLWGNPIYDWDFQKKTGFLWWKKRLEQQAKLYDAIRIDHFRGFADYYTITYGSPDARNGKWEKGVGLTFWKMMKETIGKTLIIAEDLGGETPEVERLIKDTGFPNMKILQFAFDSDLKDPFLPKNYNTNCVCYTGTHDNDTTLGWYEKLPQKEKKLFEALVPSDKSHSPVLSLISYGMKSRARLVIIPFQDYLQLPSRDRMNIPGNESGNWEWRFDKNDLTDELISTIKRLTGWRN